MRLKVLGIAAAALFGASSAQAVMINMWDMSYLEVGFPFIAPSDVSGRYPANWSDLDTGPGSGIPFLGVNQSGNFGTMIWDGLNGSTNEIPTGSGDILFTAEPSLDSNRFRPAGGDVNAPGSAVSLLGDGQDAHNDVALSIQGAMTLVWESDLSVFPLLQGATDWTLSFAARTQFANDMETLQVALSTDGGNSFGPSTPVEIDDGDKLYEVALGGPVPAVKTVHIRIEFPGEVDVLIDNVATNANLTPEPSTALLMLAGLSGLAVFGRRRTL